MDAAVAAVLSVPDAIYHVKKKKRKSNLVLAGALLNTVVHYGSPLVSDVHLKGNLQMLCGSISSKKNLIGRF